MCLVYGVQVNLEALRQSLTEGDPVIVGVKIDMTTYKGGHFMVVVEMTDTEVIVNDPGHSLDSSCHCAYQHPYPISQFLASWATQNYCAIIVDGSAGRSTTLSEKADGSAVPEILSAYFKNGGSTVLGAPISSFNPSSDGHVSAWSFPATSCLFQVFNGGSLGECAIVYDTVNSPNKAFVMHGQLWAYYKAYGGPNMLMPSGPIGGPVTDEVYVTDDETGHQLSAQRFANGYVVYDTVLGQTTTRTIANPNFGIDLAGGGYIEGIPVDVDGTVHITIIPGNGSSINIMAYAQSPTTAYITGSTVTGAAYYIVYQDGQYVGTLSPVMLDFIASGLTPSSTHTYQLTAVDSNSNVLATSAEASVTQPAEPGPQVLQVVLQPRTLSLEVSWPTIFGTSYYSVYVNGSYYSSFQPPQCTIYNLNNGETYTVQVRAYSSTGALLASGSSSKTLGQNISILTYDGAIVLLPNQQYARTYYLSNGTDDPIYNFRSDWSGIATPTGWIVLGSTTYPMPSYVAPHSEVQLCTVTFQTGPGYLLMSNTAVSVYFGADCPVPSMGLTRIERSFQDWMTIVPFTDPESRLPATMTVNNGLVTLTVSNESNSVCPPFRVEAYLNGALSVSLLSPQLAAREIWTTDIDFSTLPTDQYELILVVNSDNAVQNIRTDNDVSQCMLTVNNPLAPFVERHEAEDATLYSVAVDTDHDGYSGAGFVDQFESLSDVVGFDVNVPVTSAYLISMRYMNGNPTSATRNVWLDGTYVDTLVFPSIGLYWDSWSTASMLVTLTAGAHTIDVAYDWTDQGAINFDYLDVTQIGNLLQRYEAEDAVLTSAAIDTDHVNYQGTGFVDQYESIGDRVDFLVSVPMTGVYRLRFRYGRGEGTPATRNVYLDNLYIHRLTLSGLGSSWDVWGRSDVLVALETGVHTIGLVHDWMNGGAINLDSLEVLEVTAPIACLEAEDAFLYGLGVDTGHWGYSGDGFADGFSSQGKGANFSVAIPEAGQYQLVFCYANGVSQDATRIVYVDGQAFGELILQSLGQDQWDVWGNAVMTVMLEAGTHQIGIWYGSGNQEPINLDYLEVREAPELP